MGGIFRAGRPGDRFPALYDTAGEYIATAVLKDTAGEYVVTAKIGSVIVGSLTVTVVSVDLHGPVACQVNYQRELKVTVSPASAKGAVTYVSADAELLSVRINEPTDDGATLYLKPLCRGTPVLEARLGGATGPIISTQEIDEFTLESSIAAVFLAAGNGDGTATGTAALIMRPYVGALTVDLTVNSSGATFDNGQTQLSTTTDNFTIQPDGSGTFEYNIHVLENGYICHSIEMGQSHSEWKRIAVKSGINPPFVEFQIDELVFPKGQPDELHPFKVRVRGERPAGADVWFYFLFLNQKPYPANYAVAHGCTVSRYQSSTAPYDWYEGGMIAPLSGEYQKMKLFQKHQPPDTFITLHGSQVWAPGVYELVIFAKSSLPPPFGVDKPGDVGQVSFDNAVTVLKVEIDSIDSNFAPSAEKLDVRYTIKPPGYTASFAKIEIFKTGDAVNPIYKDTTIAKTGANVLYQWDGKANQGATSGQYVGPEDSPYTIKVSISEKADFNPSCTDAKTSKVEVESLTISPAAATVKIMNNPATQQEISVLIKLKKKDGTGVVTAVPMYVDFSFSDPGTANTKKNDSYEYAPGNFLGKKDDAAAVYWADHPSADSDSSDGYKLVCRGKTITAGEDQGKTYVYFKPSGVGGDDFQLKGAVKYTDGSELKAVDSGILTVWRQVAFGNIYEMDGETHVSTNATEAGIQPYFTPSFVDYVAGAVNAIPAAKSVKYIGLWKNAAPYQESWATISTKQAGVNYTLQYGPYAGSVVATEVPTAQELTDAAGPAGAARNAARAAITKKAQAWVERIDTAFLASMSSWTANGGIANNSFVAIKYYHPKYSRGGRRLGYDRMAGLGHGNNLFRQLCRS